MPAKQYDEIKAGLFVTLLLAALLGIILWLGSAQLFKTVPQHPVFFARETDGMMGLAVGSRVQVNDVEVGKIVALRFDPDAGGTFYEAEVYRKDMPIHADGKAFVPAALVGATPLVVTHRGTGDHPLVSKEHPLEISGQFGQALNSIERISVSLAEELDTTNKDALLVKVKSAADQIRTASTHLAEMTAKLKPELDAKNKDSLLAGIKASTAQIKVTTDNLAAMSTKLRPELDPEKKGSILANVKDTSASLAVTSKKIEAYTKKDVAELLVTIRKVGTKLLKISEDLRVTAGQARGFAQGNRENLDELVDNLSQMSLNLKAASAEIRRDPWKLLHKPTKEELASQNLSSAATAFMLASAELDQALAKLKALAANAPKGLPAEDPQLQRIRQRIDAALDGFKQAEDALYRELKQQK